MGEQTRGLPNQAFASEVSADVEWLRYAVFRARADMRSDFACSGSKMREAVD
jgi:hypothetical protein